MTRTCYIPAFTTIHQRLQMSICGRIIDQREHSSEPTCPRCRAWLEADEAEAKALSALWDREAADKAEARSRPPTRLTRHEQLEALADHGVDTWEEYRGER